MPALSPRWSWAGSGWTGCGAGGGIDGWERVVGALGAPGRRDSESRRPEGRGKEECVKYGDSCCHLRR